MWTIFLLSLLVGISNGAPAGWWASDITYSLNELKSVADYENQKAILISVNGQLINYKNYNNGHIESAIQIKIDNEIAEIRYLLGIGLYKIYSGEDVNFYSEFGAEVAYSCQEKSNISAAVDQNNLEELSNIFENIDYVFNTQDNKNDIEIIGEENEGVATIKVEPRPNSIIKPGLCGEDNKGEDLVTLFSGKMNINDPELAFDSFGMLTSTYSSDKLEKFGDLDGVNA